MSIRLFVYALLNDERGLDLWRVNACRKGSIPLNWGRYNYFKSVHE